MFSRKRIINLLLICAMLISIVSPLHASAAGEANVTACIIDSSGSKVTVTAQAPAGISTDGNLYLFSVPTYADSISGYTPVAQVAYTGAGSYTFSANLNNNAANTLLYNKFYVAAKSGSSYTALTGGNYITNPEALASSAAPRVETDSKKGLQIDFYIGSDLEDLGIQHSFFNIVFQDVFSLSPTGLSYNYNGKTYYFKESYISDYDTVVRNMTNAGMSVTVALRNRYIPGYEFMVHPGVVQTAGAIDYSVNTSTQQGLEAIAATTHFLAERYNGSNADCGRVENWVFGNEVNDNRQYYWMGEQNVDTFVQEYLQSFRVVYTAVKSAYRNANVYICLQHRWNVANGTTDYGGRSFIDKFNSYTIAQGNIDWGLAYHPYSFPMNDPDILNDGEKTIDEHDQSTFGGEVTDSVDSPVITMKNLHHFTNYFHNSNLLNPDGKVRSIILSEQGYTSYSNIAGHNEAKQAANIALGYYIAQANDDIDAFILRGMTDEWEGNQYFKFGLREQGTADGKPGEGKLAHEVYKYLDTPDSLTHTAFAKAALNVTNWADVVPGWNEADYAAMGSHTDAVLQTVSGKSGSTMLAEDMLGNWEIGYNVYLIHTLDYSGAPVPRGNAIANQFAYHMAYQGVEFDLDSPKDLSATPYLTMDLNFGLRPKSDNGTSEPTDKLEVKVRVHSGDKVFDATGIVNVNTGYTVCVDLSQWAGRSAVDGIEVLLREYGQERAFDGLFTVYNTQASAAVSGMQALQSTAKVKTDLSGAQLSYQSSFNYSGNPIEPDVVVTLNGSTLIQHEDYDVIYHDNVEAGRGKIVIVGIGNYSGYTTKTFTILGDFPTVYDGVDYSPVYAYGYYKENNPDVVAEVGDNPQAMLEHFVKKGMDYALQAKGDFNAMAYAKINDDVYAKHGNDWRAYYMHYLTKGIEEGRSTSGIQPEDMQAPVYPTTPKDCTAGHTYNDKVDGTCNVCGIHRETTENRIVMHMFRMYDPNSGEHFYTGSTEERDFLVSVGWHYEGVGFTFSRTTGSPVYRLYEPVTGEHLYTMNETEKSTLMAQGWNLEGIAFNSAYDTEVPQYRLHNPNATRGAYHFTASVEERDFLISVGWEDQGIGFYSSWK